LSASGPVVERSVIQRPIAELRRGDFGAPVAVAALFAQRIGESAQSVRAA